MAAVQKALIDFWASLNEFELYKKNHTDHGFHSNYRYSYALPFERVDDPVSITKFLQTNWHHTITISIIYFLVIKGIQFWMTSRKPYNLRTPLIMWNGSLALFSLFGFLRFGEDLLDSLENRTPYEWVCYSCHPNGVAAFWSFLFAVSKLVELGDTLFIVLRKKPLIFLHYYHHVAVLIYTVHAGAEHTAAGRAFITMNYFAHAIMYSYYTLTAIGIRVPRKISKSVTIVQTIQMLAGVAISCCVWWIKYKTNWNCQQSKPNLSLAFLIYTTFLFLFLHFYWTTYVKNSKPRPKKQTEKLE